jgi:hypothetical protein
MLFAWETRHIPDDSIHHGDRRDKLRSSKLEQSVAAAEIAPAEIPPGHYLEQVETAYF